MPEWDVIVPLRGGAAGSKSRLVGERASAGLGAALAFAFASDLIAVARSHPDVERVVVLTGHPATARAVEELGATATLDTAPGNVNASLAELSGALRAEFPGRHQAILVADLPSLTLDDLATVLDLAARHERAVLGDRAGTGTCLITAGPDSVARPRFGPDSLRAHRQCGHSPIVSPDTPTAWSDIDTPEDLRWARGELSLGPHTTAMLDRLERIPHLDEIAELSLFGEAARD